MILRAHLAGAVAVVWLLAGPISADEARGPDVEKSAATAAEPSPVDLTATTTSARLSGAAVTATTWAGYDGASDVPRVSAIVEARIVRRLTLAVGAESSSEERSQFTLRPQVTLRFQALEQAATGIDATVAATYRQDEFQEDGGFFQGTIAVGRRFDRLQFNVNFVFGIDPEGDDIEGEVRAAGSVDIGRGFRLGVDGRYMHDLGSTDPHRTERDRPTAEALGGATAAYVHGRWALMLEAGFGLITTADTRTGPVALAGYSETF